MPYSIIVTKDDESIACITIEQAAKLSGYNEQYIRRLMRGGKLRGIKISRIWLVGIELLTEYLSTVQSTQIDDARFGPRRSAQVV